MFLKACYGFFLTTQMKGLSKIRILLNRVVDSFMSGLSFFTWPLSFSLSKGIYTHSGTSHAYLHSHWSPCCFHLNLTLKQHLLAETLFGFCSAMLSGVSFISSSVMYSWLKNLIQKLIHQHRLYTMLAFFDSLTTYHL